MKLSLPAMALVLLPASVFAQDPLGGRTIMAVRVSGLTHIGESVVLAQIESAPGRPYSRTAAQRNRVR